MSLNQFGRSPLSWCLLGLAPLAFASPVASASIVVANYGTDSGSCGSSAEPCRSISQAIANAAPNEVIYVGAGRYGDVSGTGTFAGLGDEHAQPGVANGPDYQSCVICISKPVQIYSLNGAAVTYIQANSAASFQNAVYINSAGVSFGSAGHGFTISNGGGNGVVVDFEATGPSAQPMNVTVAGNVDVADAQGFVFVGSKYGTSGPAFSRRKPIARRAITDEFCFKVTAPAAASSDFGLSRGQRTAADLKDPLTVSLCSMESPTTSRLSWKTTSRLARRRDFLWRRASTFAMAAETTRALMTSRWRTILLRAIRPVSISTAGTAQPKCGNR